MYDKILVPMALDHDISPQTLAVAKALCSTDGRIVALHVYEAPQGSVSAFLDEDAVKADFARAEARMNEKLSGLPNITPVDFVPVSGQFDY